MTTLSIIQGDITTAHVDAIVNAANPYLLGGGGVDGAIHQAAGPTLLSACKKLEVINGVRCPMGEARITEAGNLSAMYVIHTVGPIYQQEKNPEQILTQSYHNSLNLALENHCCSIAFPAISCGIYGYPHKEAANIALACCSEVQYQSLTISFYLYSTSLYHLWIDALDNILHTSKNI